MQTNVLSEYGEWSTFRFVIFNMNNKIYQFQMEKILIPKFIENEVFFVGIEKTSSNETFEPI